MLLLQLLLLLLRAGIVDVTHANSLEILPGQTFKVKQPLTPEGSTGMYHQNVVQKWYQT